MGRKSKVRIVGITAAVIAGLAAVPPSARAEPGRPTPTVRTGRSSSAPELIEVGGPATSMTRASTTAGPARHVDVDTSLLKPGVARTVSVDVPDRDLEVALDPIDSGAAGWSAWKGAVAGDPEAVATVVRNGDDVAGIVSTADGSYRIRTTAPGEQVVQEIDRTFPEKADDHVTPPATADLGIAPDDVAAAGSAAETSGDVPAYPVIDVLVAYTPAALTDAGTVSAMNSEIALAIATTNTAYSDSGVNGRVRLAGTTALSENYNLSNLSLNQVTGTADGHSDSIHALRNSTGADLVSVLVHDPSSCGLAWVLNSVTASASSRSPYGFSTVDYSCAVDNYSFPHELGHNMGLNHDRYVEPSPTLYDYAVGYVNVAAG
ncbi:MAG TPA: M12 family metallo-peptidase, partial [Acidimicrobiales bacterium]|nr:M12 family metallo-peptidase [Acidimicrobiales bacterium]